MPLRVIQWGTGTTGVHGLRHVMQHPELELVGLRVYTPGKAGKTAGEIANLPNARGADVVATRDEEALIAMDADAVLFMDSDRTLTDPRIPGTETYVMVDKICRLLESGKNVVSTTVVGMGHPAFFGAAVYDRIEAACKKGKSSTFTTGIEPGIMGDLLPLTMSSLSTKITQVRTIQILNYADYHHEGTFNAYGFGKKPDDPTLVSSAHSNRYLIAWGVVPVTVAAGLGVKLDDIIFRTETGLTTFRFDTFAGPVEAGTIAAHRFQVIGIVGGEERIVIEHVSRIHPDVMPEWESMGAGKEGFRIVIEGVPSMTVDVLLGNKPHRTPNEDACIGTAARAANAIPAVCAASPGPKTIFDLPMIMGKYLLK